MHREGKKTSELSHTLCSGPEFTIKTIPWEQKGLGRDMEMEKKTTQNQVIFGADIFALGVSDPSSHCHLYEAHVVHMGFLFTLSGGAGLLPVISAPSLQYPGKERKKMSFRRRFLLKHQNNVRSSLFFVHFCCTDIGFHLPSASCGFCLGFHSFLLL